MTKKVLQFAIAVAAVVAIGVALVVVTGPGATFTLYRTSALDKAARIHVATFDADAPASYNQENCATAQKLFAEQDGVTVSFWCEKGTYRK